MSDTKREQWRQELGELLLAVEQAAARPGWSEIPCVAWLSSSGARQALAPLLPSASGSTSGEGAADAPGRVRLAPDSG